MSGELPVPAWHHRTPTGWADDRLMEAYDLIHAVMADHVTAEDAMPELRALLAEVEKADQVLADVIRGRVS